MKNYGSMVDRHQDVRCDSQKEKDFLKGLAIFFMIGCCAALISSFAFYVISNGLSAPAVFMPYGVLASVLLGCLVFIVGGMANLSAIQNQG